MIKGITIQEGFLWVLIWLGFMVLHTTLNIVLWKNITPDYSGILNIITIILCMAYFLSYL